MLYNDTKSLVNIFDELLDYPIENKVSNIMLNDVHDEIDLRDCYFFRLEEIIFDNEYPHREALENVLAAIDNPSFNFIYIISGNKQQTKIYLGIAKNKFNNKSNLSSSDYAIDILQTSFLGNFSGSKMTSLKRDEIVEEIMNPLKKSHRTSMIMGTPSINEEHDKKGISFQGIDRLINSMEGTNWQLVIVCEPVEMKEIRAVKERLYNIYNVLYRNSKISIQQSNNWGWSDSTTEGTSENKTKNIGTSESESINHSAASESTSTGISSSKNTSSGISVSKGSSYSEAQSQNQGKANSISIELIDKQTSELLEHLEKLLERINEGSSKGLFKTSMYALAQDKLTHERLQNSVMSIFQGNTSTFSSLFPQYIDEDMIEVKNKMICSFQNHYVMLKVNESIPLTYGNSVKEGKMGLATYMTAREVSLVGGLPIKEVAGLSLREGVEFGLNIERHQNDVDCNCIDLGCILHRGKRLESNRIYIDKEHINKHIFIGGVTGSGKTTTCQKLLIESALPFMVIEPAKTEYRELYGKKKMNGLRFYTLGNEKLAPFRLNPFELLKKESLTAHIDLLKATFSAVFPMEAAMPQILEAAIYETYREYGWDVDTDENDYCTDPWNANGLYWPTLTDLIRNLKTVIKNQGFGQELEKNYIGALVSRISNLTIGSKGRMMNCKKSVDFYGLLDKKVVLEMEDLKSPEDKALMMGFILARMIQVLKERHMEDRDFKHITLIEEAHRLLSKVEPGEGGAKKHSVQMFADILAEVRKYGEGLIIVDQIPNKLALDVLKNTNTKIIHKIFARDDKEVVGDTMSMDDTQKQYLSNLRTGEAIMFSQNWNKPIHVKIQQGTNTTDKVLSEDVMKDMGIEQMTERQCDYFPALKMANCILKKEEVEIYKNNRNKLLQLFSDFAVDQKINSKEFESLRSKLISLAKNIQRNEKKLLYDAIAYEIILMKGSTLLNENLLEIANFYRSLLLSIENGDEDEIKQLVSNRKNRIWLH